MNSDYKVFISSTSDLKDERAEAIQAVLAANCTPVSMENWAATSAKPTERIVEKLTACHFFILLAGVHYGGTISDTDKSYVQLEYEEAIRLGLPKSIFIKNAPGTTIENPQEKFRLHLMSQHTTQSWDDLHDVGRLVLGSLFEMISDRQSAAVFDLNVSLVNQLDQYLSRTRPAAGTRKAYLVQYSGVHAVEIMRRLLRSDIDTSLFVISPKSNYLISKYQKERLIRNIREIRNQLDPGDRHCDLDSLLHIYGYDVPGSVRALLLDRVSSEGSPVHELVAFAPYWYMKKTINNRSLVDVRGGEMPGVILDHSHDGFNVVAGTIAKSIDNWLRHGIAKPLRF